MRDLFIDTDCGMDDIVAIAMLISSGKFNIAGVTTVKGLTKAETGANNLRKICNFLYSSISVCPGSNTPIGPLFQKNSFPKSDIINSSSLPFLKTVISEFKTKSSDNNYLDFFNRRVCSNRNKIDLLCLGPLTNIANAITKYGFKFTGKINQVFIMGGAVFVPGNVTPDRISEYNFYLDPQAAKIVLSGNLNIKLIPIDATKFVPVTQTIMDKISKLKPKYQTGIIIQQILLANQNDFRYFYDPLAAAILLNPKIITKTQVTGIKIIGSGQTISTSNQKSQTNVVIDINPLKFYNMLLTCITD